MRLRARFFRDSLMSSRPSREAAQSRDPYDAAAALMRRMGPGSRGACPWAAHGADPRACPG
jgi:hypothetical protein